MTYRFPALACVAAALTFPSFSHASDIDCGTLGAQAGPSHAQRLICESALFSMGYQRIYAGQQRLLKAGSISEADIAAFRARRDQCDSAACLDRVFREWRAFAADARRQR